MDQYKHIFYGDLFPQTIFFKIITTTEYPNLDIFEKSNPDKFKIWTKFAINKFEKSDDKIYLENACFYPEQSKIVGFGYGLVSNGEEGLKRTMDFIFDCEDEKILISRIFQLLSHFAKEINNPLLCGHNISGYDIPFLIKRGLKYQLNVPNILKDTLLTKPWESNLLDTVNLWKFGGSDYTSLECLVSHLNLKYKSLPLSLDAINHAYWKDQTSASREELIKYETLNFINLSIQLMRLMKEM